MLTTIVAAAVLHAAQSTGIGDGCSPAEVRAAAARAETTRLGRVEGRDVILVSMEAPCLCGTVNCPWLVLRLDSNGPRVLLQTSAFSVAPTGGAQPLPALRESAHDSALITDETLDVFRNGRYVVAETARVRGDTGASKPNGIPVRFAPGTSSARLSGAVSQGWYDEYVFSARRGQRLMIDAVRSRATVSATLFGRDETSPIELRPGVAVTLPDSGSYTLHVENDSDVERPDVPYSLELSIR